MDVDVNSFGVGGNEVLDTRSIANPQRLKQSHSNESNGEYYRPSAPIGLKQKYSTSPHTSFEGHGSRHQSPIALRRSVSPSMQRDDVNKRFVGRSTSPRQTLEDMGLDAVDRINLGMHRRPVSPRGRRGGLTRNVEFLSRDMKNNTLNTTTKEARSDLLFTLIKGRKWNSLLDRIDECPGDAMCWIQEKNQDDTLRWKSLPIHLACEMKPPLEVVTNLLRIYPESISIKNYGEDIPLHIACREGAKSEVISYLIIREPVDSCKTVDGEGRLPLHLAARSGTDPKIITNLLDLNPKAIRAPDDFGLLPLHWSCIKSASAAVIESLIQAYPYGVETKDAWGRTPRLLAKQSKSPEKEEIIQMLAHDANFWTSKMMSTITKLSTKLVASEEIEQEYHRAMMRNDTLIEENKKYRKEVQQLQVELRRLEGTLIMELEELEDNHAAEVKDLKLKYEQSESELLRKNIQSEKLIDDLRGLVEDIIEKLKTQKEAVDEKEIARRGLKESAVTLVQRLKEERMISKHKDNENIRLKRNENNLLEEIERKDRELTILRRQLRMR